MNDIVPLLLNHLWQSTVIAATTLLVGLALGRYRPAVRFRVWLVGSLQFLFPLALFASLGGWLRQFVHWSRPAAEVAGASLPLARQLGTALFVPASNAGLDRAASHGASPWMALLLMVWACGAIAVLVDWLREWLRIRALVREATPLDLGLPMPTVSGPARLEMGVFGVLGPVLYVPEGLPQALSAGELRAVLAHEMCHVRRRDNLWAALQMLVQAVFWFHPLVWWLGRLMARDRELACDEGTLRQGAPAGEYATGLLKVCKQYTTAPAACMAGLSGADLKQRVLWIAGGALAPALGAPLRWLLALLVAAAVATPLAAGMLRGPAQIAPSAILGTGFSAASIRPADTSGKVHHFAFKIEPNRLTVEYFTVRDLLEEAYQLQDYQIRLSSAGKNNKALDRLYEYQPFDIQAVTASPVASGEMRTRLGRLVMDRFHVVSHWDTEAIPMYRLEVLPGGIHLKKADSGYAVPNSPTGNRAACALEFTGPMSMPQLAGMLTQWMTKPKPVVDRTGIGGYYLVGLKFQWPGCVPSDMERDVDTPAGALKGIGLTLTPAHDPVKVLVVDGIGPVEEN